MYRIVLIIALLALVGCYTRDLRMTSHIRPPVNSPTAKYSVKTTGYCPCGICCNWRRNWLGRPVIASGPNEGNKKAVGITASGTRAQPGTIAADTSIFPFGTIMYVPGYGYGKVEDIGGDIKGYHIDLFFHSHATAERWGVQRKVIQVWMP